MKMVNFIPKFEYFTVFLKNRNIISKIRRSKVTDYAALNYLLNIFYNFWTTALPLMSVEKWLF